MPRHTARTRHFNSDGTPRYTNKLQGQTSPYLLQHVHNPVQWWPWGDDAFAEARRRDMPVFLSVGYATCHWCHVMEEESFEDEDIAAVMNEHFVCIKLDREERPDVDAVYMTAVQAMTGRGGWPMSVWLTPDTRRPFFCGTYFPPHDGDRGQRVGFRSILLRIAESYRDEKARVVESADNIAAELLAFTKAPASGDSPGLSVVDDLVAACASRFDRTWGGVGTAPKFPSQTPLRALMRHSVRTGTTVGKDMAVHTLTKMIDGGLFDHVGGGFHRYSVDEQWLVPHFEKMLYDNALLVPALLDAWQLTGDDRFQDAARRTLAFIDRDLSLPSGAFASATDADSPVPSGAREEGYFFTWTLNEVSNELGLAGFSDDDVRAVCAAYDITAAGNFEGRSIPHFKKYVSESPLLARAREVLLRVRMERPAPLRDTKAITAWNGLAISAFAYAGFVLDDDGYSARAVRAFDAVDSARKKDGSLWRVPTTAPGVLDDYAFFCRAALDLFDGTGELRFLDEAIALDTVLARGFEDAEHGGFFITANNAEALLLRDKPDRDGAEPSGNSVHAENLVRLALLTDDDRFRQRADKTMRAFSQLLHKHPQALSEMTTAIELEEASREIVVCVPKHALDDDGRQLLSVLRRRPLGARVVVWQRGDDEALQAKVPLARERAATDKLTVYVCQGGACRLPATTSRALLDALALP